MARLSPNQPFPPSPSHRTTLTDGEGRSAVELGTATGDSKGSTIDSSSLHQVTLTVATAAAVMARCEARETCVGVNEC